MCYYFSLFIILMEKTDGKPSSMDDWFQSRCQSLLMRSLLSRIERSGLRKVSLDLNLLRMDVNEVFHDGSQQSLLHAVFQFVKDQLDLVRRRHDGRVV